MYSEIDRLSYLDNKLIGLIAKLGKWVFFWAGVTVKFNVFYKS